MIVGRIVVAPQCPSRRSRRTRKRLQEIGQTTRLGDQRHPPHIGSFARSRSDVDTDFMVLEGNQRNSNTRISAEPELERNVEGLGRGSLSRQARDGGLSG